MPTIQNAGVDTLEFSFDVEVGQAMWDRLEEEKEVVQLLMKTRKAEHVPDWLNAVVHPVGAKGGYRFLLETPTFSIKLLKGVPNRPPIQVEMRAYGLHSHEDGAIGACEAACAFIRDTLLADEDPEWTAKVINLDEARCSRLDLFIDWQGGWHPTFENGDERAFIKRVHADVGRYSVNGKVNGYEIGKSSVRGRIYNKTVQCKKKHVEWYLTLLQARSGIRYGRLEAAEAFTRHRDYWERASDAQRSEMLRLLLQPHGLAVHIPAQRIERLRPQPGLLPIFRLALPSWYQVGDGWLARERSLESAFDPPDLTLG